MPDTLVACTEGLASTEYHAGHRASTAASLGMASAEPETIKPLPEAGESADVGLTQKGTDEDAIVRRETDV